MRRTAAVLLTTLALAACGSDKPTEPTPEAQTSGTLSYMSTGVTGSFSATGGFLTNASEAASQSTPWAVGYRNQQNTGIGIVANQPTSGGLSTLVGLSFNRLTAGSLPITSDCQPGSTTCASFVVVVGVPAYGSGGTNSHICMLSSGTATLATVTATRVTGTFAGAGTCIAPGGQTEFIATNGSFDVMLGTEVPGA
jgi:hypothetical protein